MLGTSKARTLPPPRQQLPGRQRLPQKTQAPQTLSLQCSTARPPRRRPQTAALWAREQRPQLRAAQVQLQGRVVRRQPGPQAAAPVAPCSLKLLSLRWGPMLNVRLHLTRLCATHQLVQLLT